MSMNRQSAGLTVALLFLWIAVRAAGSSPSSSESPDAGVSEPADLAVCEKNSDCIVVPYSHCCGSTRRAINRRYEVEYSKHKEWQSFNDPEQCALMGACPDDKHINKVRCRYNRCELIHPGAHKNVPTK